MTPSVLGFRLTGMTHEGGSIALVYDVRGNVITDTRTITGAGTAKVIAYAYNTILQKIASLRMRVQAIDSLCDPGIVPMKWSRLIADPPQRCHWCGR